METWTIETLLQAAARYLKEKGSSSPRLDAELLLAKALDVDRVQLYMEFDRPLDTAAVDHYRSLVRRRARHEPVAYILGQAHFRRLCLSVGPDVLIPRPETEELVDVALELLKRRPPWGALPPVDRADAAANESGQPIIVDVGTGSGAIALSLALEAGVRVLATDTSLRALELAAANAATAGVERLVDFRNADLLAGIDERTLHLVVSNPPYIRSEDLQTLAPDIRLYEPLSALDGGPDGLDVYRRLLPQAARALRPGGALLLEVGHDQALAVAELIDESDLAFVAVHKDLSGKDRIVEAAVSGAWPVPLAPPPGRSLDVGETAALQEALRAGAIIGIPTDTVYGIAARWDSNPGVRRLFTAKGRPPEQPVQVLFSSVRAIEKALPDLDPGAARVLDALLPGPFTFVVATGVPRPDMVGTPESLGVRVPDHAALLALLELLDAPLAATSANPSGERAVVSLSDVDPTVLAYCTVAFDDPALSPRGIAADSAARARTLPSTVVDLRPLASGGEPVIIREGAVPADHVLRSISAL